MTKKKQEPERKKPERKEPPVPAFVPMVRSAEDAKGGPTTASVHPSQVEEWKAAGWRTEKGE